MACTKLCAALAALVFATPSLAGEGEFNFDLVFAPEVASAVHPNAPADTAPFSDAATLIFKPRLGAGVRYGLSSSFYAGVGAQVAPSTAITTKGVQLEQGNGDILTASYLELQVPLKF